MPVYFITCHAYRSWSEADPRGYVQRGEGLKPAAPVLARWREEQATQPPTRFDDRQKEEILRVVAELAQEDQFTWHAGAATATHLHMLISFRLPLCQCHPAGTIAAHGGGIEQHCRPGCPALARAQAVVTHVKRVAGVRLAKAARVRGRKWFSRGWDVTAVRQRTHFDYLVRQYLPKHRSEGGIVRVI